MIDPAIDTGGLKDFENAPNSFFPKINQTVFWHSGAAIVLTKRFQKKSSGLAYFYANNSSYA